MGVDFSVLFRPSVRADAAQLIVSSIPDYLGANSGWVDGLALTIGKDVAVRLTANQKWIAEQPGTSIAMIQEHSGRYIRDDGDLLFRAYLAKPKPAKKGAARRNLWRNLLSLVLLTLIRH